MDSDLEEMSHGDLMRGCVNYRQSLDGQAADAPRTTEPYGD